MVAFLIRTYGKKGTEGEATSAIIKMTQADNETFIAFYTKQQEHRSRVEMTPAVELFMLEEKLNYKYTQKVASYSKDLDKFVEACYREEERFTRLAAKSNRGRGKGASICRNRQARRGSGRGGRRGGGAVSTPGLKLYSKLPDKFKGLLKLDEATRAALIRLGNCLRCYKPGYYSRDPKCILKQYELLLYVDKGKATAST